ncbi:MAG: hypothetical protein DMG73_20405 [Acidobacteria bacterium]|nr:MAG: hypothetical protein DMG73_20405 [Acidobacteriota bacterium]
MKSDVKSEADQASMDRLETRSDAGLLQLSLAGEESAFLLLYGRLKGGIFRYAYYMTCSRTEAEEVTQEVFISLLKEGGSYREELGDVAGFAFGIARNFVRRIERRERAYQPFPDGDALEDLSDSLVSQPEALPGQMIRNGCTQRLLRFQTTIARWSFFAICVSFPMRKRPPACNVLWARFGRA